VITGCNYSSLSSRRRETEPLLPSGDFNASGGFTWILVVALVAGIVTGSIVTYTATKCNYCVEADRMERIRAGWELERLHHDTEAAEREVDRHRWRLEDVAHADKLERWRREDEERQRLGFFWADFEALNCVRHETRVYSARLENVPSGFEHRIEACRETEMSVNGVMRKPTRCEDKGANGLFGFWDVEGEAECGTYFNWFKDKGCTARWSGYKRYEMYMENLRPGDDWQVMCSSTPASFMGMTFSHPHYCVRWGEGTYGLWDIKDGSC